MTDELKIYPRSENYIISDSLRIKFSLVFISFSCCSVTMIPKLLTQINRSTHLLPTLSWCFIKTYILASLYQGLYVKNIQKGDISATLLLKPCYIWTYIFVASLSTPFFMLMVEIFLLKSSTTMFNIDQGILPVVFHFLYQFAAFIFNFISKCHTEIVYHE